MECGLAQHRDERAGTRREALGPPRRPRAVARRDLRNLVGQRHGHAPRAPELFRLSRPRRARADRAADAGLRGGSPRDARSVRRLRRGRARRVSQVRGGARAPGHAPRDSGCGVRGRRHASGPRCPRGGRARGGLPGLRDPSGRRSPVLHDDPVPGAVSGSKPARVWIRHVLRAGEAARDGEGARSRDRGDLRQGEAGSGDGGRRPGGLLDVLARVSPSRDPADGRGAAPRDHRLGLRPLPNERSHGRRARRAGGGPEPGDLRGGEPRRGGTALLQLSRSGERRAIASPRDVSDRAQRPHVERDRRGRAAAAHARRAAAQRDDRDRGADRERAPGAPRAVADQRSGRGGRARAAAPGAQPGAREPRRSGGPGDPREGPPAGAPGAAGRDGRDDRQHRPSVAPAAQRARARDREHRGRARARRSTRRRWSGSPPTPSG